jgi:1-phosphatidylinositol-4-phosphate 5-kinase
MFFFCWVGVERGRNNNFSDFDNFFLATFFLYYLWHIIFWVFSLTVTVAAGCILWGHLAASSETRKFVLKQNLIYVLVLGIETFFIIAFWIIQFILVRNSHEGHGGYFFTKTDLGLAVAFAIIHSLRGAVDLFVWRWNFSIGLDDCSHCFKRCRVRLLKEQYVPPTPSLKDPLLTTDTGKDNLINKALRRDAIYCINLGILDAVQRDLERSRRNRRVGSVRDGFAAAALVELDQENQRDEVALLHTNPSYRDQVARKIPFPTSSTHIKDFSFVDLEPNVFSLLREGYGISPHSYKKSFEINTASDIDSVRFIEKSTEGKSGSFFYFTPDNRFIIKNVTASEEKFLCKIAYKYYEHMRENKDSLIVRFFGLHKVRLAPEQRYITVVVMENIFYTEEQRKIHRRFDLKGSWVGRRSLKTGQSPDEYKGTLKDLDLGEEKIFIGSDQKEQLMDLLIKDVAFLTKCRIMDYSLLLGVLQDGVNTPESASSSQKFGDFPTAAVTSLSRDPFESLPGSLPRSKARTFSRTFGYRRDTVVSNGSDDKELHIPWYRQDGGGLNSVSSFPHDFELSSNRNSMVNVGNPPVTYFFGVVDILQEYTLRKKLEHQWKTRILGYDKLGLSAVNEMAYGNRFLKFLDKVIE